MVNPLYKKGFFTTGGGGTTLPTDSAGFLYNNGTGTISWAANGSGDLLANGTIPLTANWAMGAFELSQATWKGVAVGVGYGGTGLASYAVGDILYASGATALSKLAAVATGQMLVSAGLTTAPAWSASPTLTGTLTALNLTADPSLAATLLTNGDFATDPTGTNTPWMEGTSTNIGTAWVYATGKLRHATASTTTLRQGIAATSGQLLKVMFTIAQDGATPIAGTIKVTVGGTSSTGISDVITVAAGTYTRWLYASGTSTYYVTFTPSTTLAATIDDISVQVATEGVMTNSGVIVNGKLQLALGDSNNPILIAKSDPTGCGMFYIPTSGSWAFGSTANTGMRFTASAAGMVNTLGYIFMRDATTRLYSDADYMWDFRNGTNANALRVYGTYASATSYERGFFRTTATALEIGTEKGSGGGTARPVDFHTDGILRAEIDTSGNWKHVGANLQSTNIQQATAVVTTTAAATATATNLIPAGCLLIGVTTRVTTAVTGDAGFTGYSVGNGTDADMFGANVSPSLNATTDLTNSTITAPVIYTAATSIVLTQVGGSTFVAGGVVRVTVHYISLTAPTT